MNDTVFTEMFMVIDYGYLLHVVDFMLLCTPYCCQYLLCTSVQSHFIV